MVDWFRELRSGQKVSYNGLVLSEVIALATALDEWEIALHHRQKDIIHDAQAK
jgi:hypothetical protein